MATPSSSLTAFVAGQVFPHTRFGLDLHCILIDGFRVRQVHDVLAACLHIMDTVVVEDLVLDPEGHFFFLFGAIEQHIAGAEPLSIQLLATPCEGEVLATRNGSDGFGHVLYFAYRLNVQVGLFVHCELRLLLNLGKVGDLGLHYFLTFHICVTNRVWSWGSFLGHVMVLIHLGHVVVFIHLRYGILIHLRHIVIFIRLLDVIIIRLFCADEIGRFVFFLPVFIFVR